MYDLTLEESFDNVGDWLKEVRQNADPEVVIFLVGNMVDLASERRRVTTDAAEQFARTHNLAGFTEASAKTSENVNE